MVITENCLVCDEESQGCEVSYGVHSDGNQLIGTRSVALEGEEWKNRPTSWVLPRPGVFRREGFIAIHLVDRVDIIPNFLF